MTWTDEKDLSHSFLGSGVRDEQGPWKMVQRNWGQRLDSRTVNGWVRYGFIEKILQFSSEDFRSERRSRGPSRERYAMNLEVMEFQLSYYKSWKMMLWKCCTQMPANLENSAVATGLEKVHFHSNPKERQCQRMLKLLHNCTHLTH